MEIGTPNITGGSGVVRIGTNGLLRHRPPHGPARSNGGRNIGTNMIMMIRHGGTEI